MFLQCALMTKLVETALTCSMCAHMLPLLIRLHLSFLNQSCHVLSAVRALRECAADCLQHQLQAKLEQHRWPLPDKGLDSDV